MQNDTPTIEFASQDKVDDLESYVNLILDAMGYESAFVTDESTLWDFHTGNLLVFHRIKKALKHRFGLEVHEDSVIVDIAANLKDSI